MSSSKHRDGCGFDRRAPTGLMEHSIHGTRMEQSFESRVYNTLFATIMKISTSDRVLKKACDMDGSPLIVPVKTLADVAFKAIDKRLFQDVAGAKQALLGSTGASKYRSALFGYLWELVKKYIHDWSDRQTNGTKVPAPVRVESTRSQPLPPTGRGMKQVRAPLAPFPTISASRIP